MPCVFGGGRKRKAATEDWTSALQGYCPIGWVNTVAANKVTSTVTLKSKCGCAQCKNKTQLVVRRGAHKSQDEYLAKIAGKLAKYAAACEHNTHTVPNALGRVGSGAAKRRRVEDDVTALKSKVAELESKLQQAQIKIRRLGGTVVGGKGREMALERASTAEWGESKDWEYTNQKSNTINEIKTLIALHCTPKGQSTADSRRCQSILQRLNSDFCDESKDDWLALFPKRVQRAIFVDRCIVDRVRDGLQVVAPLAVPCPSSQPHLLQRVLFDPPTTIPLP